MEQYAMWCEEGQPGRDLVEASFRPSKFFVGTMCGWTVKIGEVGTGYCRNGVQYLSLNEQLPSMKGLKPLTLELNELVPPKVEVRAGNLLMATLEDAKARKVRSKSDD